MSENRIPRRRAVRLTAEARERLGQALVERWQAGGEPGKLTRERRAGLLGVSVATAEKLLARKGVDRPTLALAFRSVGLRWDESFCEPTATEPPEAPAAEEAVEAVPTPAVPERVPESPAPILPRRRSGRLWAFGAALGALAFAGMRPTFGASFTDAEIEGAKFYAQLGRGTTAYQGGEYGAAKRDLNRAIATAKDGRSAGQLSSALLVAGDLATAAGEFPKAKADYVQAIGLRVAFDQAVCLPPLQDSLGDVETKMRDFADARRNLARSRDGYRSFGDPVGVALATRDLGTLAYEAGDFREADDLFRQSLQTVEGLDKPEIRADVEARQALLWGRRGRTEAARGPLRRCLEFWGSRRHPRWIARTELQLGTVEAAAGNRAAAMVLFSQSAAGFAGVGDAAGAAEARRGLARSAPLVAKN